MAAAAATTARNAVFLARRRHQVYDQVIRVDLAGELAADRIYAGQLAVLAHDPKHGPVIVDMWRQEKEHLRAFQLLNLKHRCSRSLLTPFWSVAGFALGAGCALLGPRAAMACTVAVERVITQHYDQQIRLLIADNHGDRHADMLQKLKQFRDDEQEHHDTGLNHDAESAVAYPVLSHCIDLMCRIAITIAKRV